MKMFRGIVRYILKVNEYETINGALDRYTVKFKKRVLKKSTIYDNDLKKALLDLGIEKGDNLMVHSSWREFYNYEGKPEDIIKILKEIIGEEGSIFMPSYGVSKTYFDVDETKTNAGVIAEVFRTQSDTLRSPSPHFSISGQGPAVHNVIKDHFNSKYGFDENSAYYKLAQLNNAKLVFMGLGKKPTKISLFHCAGSLLKDKDPFLKELLSYKYQATLVYNNRRYEKNMITRKPEVRNNNKNFKRIYDSITKKSVSTISNLDLVVIDAHEGLEKAIKHAEEGIYCYK